MPRGLRRFHESLQSHFVTFSCYRRRANFQAPAVYDLFLVCLEETRRLFGMRVYGYVVMPEHVHLLISEPEQGRLAGAIHHLKLSFAKRAKKIAVTGPNESFWQKRYYDRNVRDGRELTVKLRYLHRNPVKRGLVSNPQDWPWSSFATMRCGKLESSRSSRSGQPPTANNRQPEHHPGSSSAQVSVQNRDANLGHPAAIDEYQVERWGYDFFSRVGGYVGFGYGTAGASRGNICGCD